MQIKILIVEDDSDIQALLKEMLLLHSPNCSIDMHISPRKAIVAIEHKSYDIVISDMGLVDSWVGGDSVLEAAKKSGCFTVLYSGINGNCSPCDFKLPKVLDATKIDRLFSAYEKYTQSPEYLKVSEGKYKNQLKKQLQKMGIRVIGNYVCKKDVLKLLNERMHR